MSDNQKMMGQSSDKSSPYPKREYTCQVDNFTTTDPDAFDEHIKQTGHVYAQDNMGRDEHHLKEDEVPDTMFAHQITRDTGNGLNTGDFVEDEAAEENSRSRAFSEGQDITSSEQTAQGNQSNHSESSMENDNQE